MLLEDKLGTGILAILNDRIFYFKIGFEIENGWYEFLIMSFGLIGTPNALMSSTSKTLR